MGYDLYDFNDDKKAAVEKLLKILHMLNETEEMESRDDLAVAYEDNIKPAIRLGLNVVYHLIAMLNNDQNYNLLMRLEGLKI